MNRCLKWITEETLWIIFPRWIFRHIRKKGESHETEYMRTQFNKFVYGQLFFYSVCLQSAVFSQSSVSAKAMVKSGIQNLYFG